MHRACDFVALAVSLPRSTICTSDGRREPGEEAILRRTACLHLTYTLYIQEGYSSVLTVGGGLLMGEGSEETYIGPLTG